MPLNEEISNSIPTWGSISEKCPYEAKKSYACAVKWRPPKIPKSIARAESYKRLMRNYTLVEGFLVDFLLTSQYFSVFCFVVVVLVFFCLMLKHLAQYLLHRDHNLGVKEARIFIKRVKVFCNLNNG